MARILNAVPGSVIKVMYPVEKLTPMGMSLTLKTMNMRLGAIFETGLYDIDANWAYVHMETARRLFSLPEGSAQALQFKTDDLDGVGPIARRIQEKAGSAYFTSTWIDSHKSLFSALKLQKLGLIRYARGRITVLDRAGLEQRTCECYAVVRIEYERLLPGRPAA